MMQVAVERAPQASATPAGRRLRAVWALLPVALAVAGCQSSRFDSGSSVYGSPQRRVASAPPLEPDVTAPGPTSRVDASPLPPAPGTSIAPVAPGTPVIDPATGQPAVASLGTTATPAPAPAAPPPTRAGAVGRWTAKEAAGSCGVNLSSTPALDLYKANTSGCANKDLQSVNAWELRDGEVYLYARGGVVARLRDSGGQFAGVIAKSGAPLTLSK
ncbi:AprI/Inh family metalloprotease inhibitor [Chelatococcus reniformis]|uniref:Outer membrane lipoprotein omp19 n=1 Tax=Chelatococcus reniformis TaxID=1494448 RepID=A0A916TXX7_9HYPH|nr:AprI/Inh family metalloprotease inhibitor [Chelatococcus reniformis]GGC51263.1 outer membrane lipoprotein omp19 [Chelatococcus reniformis]